MTGTAAVGDVDVALSSEDHASVRPILRQAQILEQIARGDPLLDILDAITRFIEDQAPEMRCSILILDADGCRLRHGAAPSLPTPYVEAIDGLVIGPLAGSCGTAAYLNESVIVAEIAQDARWAAYAGLARAHGLAACWSTPIRARDGAVLGTFAMYYGKPGLPSTEDLERIEVATHLAAIALERHRDDQERLALLQAQSRREEIDAERQRLLDLLMQAPASICLLRGPEHVFEFANPRYLLLVPRRDLIGKPIRDALPEVAGQGFFELLDEVYRTGEAYHGTETPVSLDRQGDGGLEQGFFNFVYQPVRDPDGTVVGILAHAVEVTEQVHARRRLEALAAENARLYDDARLAMDALAGERDRLQQVIDALPEGIAIADARGLITVSNAVAQSIWGQTPPSADAHHYDQAFGVWHLDGTPYRSEDLPLARSVLRGEIVHGVQMLLENRPTGQRRPVLVNSAPLRDEQGAIVGGVAVFQDIARLRELDRQKDEFLAAVSHDLKTPLTAVSLQAQMLERALASGSGADAEYLSTVVGRLRGATERMADLIESLLDLHRMQLGRPLELRREPVDLNAVVRSAIAELPAGDRHPIQVDASVESLTGCWDGIRLTRVAANLLSNALKYSPAGVAIAVTLDQEIEDGVPWAVLVVRDQGIGIPVAELSRIGERFYRASNVPRQVGGTGLGLASARQTVQQHGGVMTVASQEGRGTTVTIRLPMGGDALTPGSLSPGPVQ